MGKKKNKGEIMGRFVENILDMFGFMPKKYLDIKDTEFSRKVSEKEEKIRRLENMIEEKDKCLRALEAAAEMVEEKNKILEAATIMHISKMSPIFSNGCARWINAPEGFVDKMLEKEKVTIRRRIPVNGYEIRVERRKK